MESANSKTNEAMELGAKHGKNVAALAKADPNIDPKKLKRVLASRQYSQKYRMKQLQYIIHLETEVKALQAEVAINSPRIKYADRQNCLLQIENRSLKQRLSAFSNDLMFKEAEHDEIQNQRSVLKQIQIDMANHQLQELFKAPAHNNNDGPPTF